MKICLDPGHGGYDSGAVGNGLLEKNLTLAICLELKPILEYNGISTILTRDGDYALGHLEGNLNGELRARVDIAEKNKVDLFVSVHINACGGNGTEILVVGKGGRAELAANKVLPYLVSAGSWANRGVKVQNVLVLRDTSMPAILTENGFIDSVADATKLKDPNFRKALAVAHAKGLCDYFGIQFKPEILYRVILDGKQTMALSSLDNAITEVKRAVESGQAIRGVVQRNTDGVIVFEYSLPKTRILGNETVTLTQCQKLMAKSNPNAPDIIHFYKEKGELLGIRWGLAVAQMFRETGFLRFGGVILAGQNNFAGIGPFGGESHGASFSTPEEGVLAHLEHLYAYASIVPLPVGLPKVDPRFDLVTRGSAPSWEDLNGRWAIPGTGYGEAIVNIYKEIATQ